MHRIDNPTRIARLLDAAREAEMPEESLHTSAWMRIAARLLRDRRLDVLDINFGCPAKKVVKKCGGSALLANVPLLEEIVRARWRKLAAGLPLSPICKRCDAPATNRPFLPTEYFQEALI